MPMKTSTPLTLSQTKPGQPCFVAKMLLIVPVAPSTRQLDMTTVVAAGAL
jgi:hypothetical protein